MKLVTMCQSCRSARLREVFHLGNLPLVNDYRPTNGLPKQQVSYPATLLRCEECTLVQLGCVLPREVLFPKSYPYTSSTTRALRDNFADLAREVRELGLVKPGDLVIDIGGNDGNLLSNFVGEQRVLNVTPERIGEIASGRGIETLQSYWEKGAGAAVEARAGKAQVVTATNVFAHVGDPHEFVAEVLSVLAPGGVFVTESHYLGSLLKNVEFDAVYHEHLRYYSLESLTRLLEAHGLEVFYARQIPSHGGSIRVYAARKGEHAVREFEREPLDCSEAALSAFVHASVGVKHALWAKLLEAGFVVGIGAPSRAATLLSFCGITETTMPLVYEISGSHKIGHFMPGTRIRVMEEPERFEGGVYGAAMLLSWHIASDLGLRDKGFTDRIIAPLPEPRFL